MIDPDHPRLSIVRQCELASVSRASFYREPAGEREENLVLMRLIDEAFLDCPFYGARQMIRHLRRLGWKAGRKRVRQLMRKIGLAPIYQAPKTSAPHPQHKVYPYLLRHLTIGRPNQVWCADVTYIPMRRGFLYLVAIMDWATRKVLAWCLSNTMEADAAEGGSAPPKRRRGSVPRRGGVGLLFAQWARALGVRVIGTVSNDAKAAAARQAGCIEVIDYAKEDFLARVRDLTGGEGVAAVFDSIGRDTFMKSLEVLRPRGVLVAFGQASGSPPAFDPFLLAPKALHVTWPGRHIYTASRQQLETSAADLFDAIREGILEVGPSRTYAFEDIISAHRDLESRQIIGAAVIEP